MGGPTVKFFNFFSEFFKKILKFPKIYFGILRSRSRSEIDFLDKNLEKSSEYNTPLFSYLRDIQPVGAPIIPPSKRSVGGAFQLSLPTYAKLNVFMSNHIEKLQTIRLFKGLSFLNSKDGTYLLGQSILKKGFSDVADLFFRVVKLFVHAF